MKISPLLRNSLAVSAFLIPTLSTVNSFFETNVLLHSLSFKTPVNLQSQHIKSTVNSPVIASHKSTSNCKWECWYDPISKTQQCGRRCSV